MRLKFELYEEAAVKEYWIVNPFEENIVVIILQENGKFGGAKCMQAATLLIPMLLKDCILKFLTFLNHN